MLSLFNIFKQRQRHQIARKIMAPLFASTVAGILPTPAWAQVPNKVQDFKMALEIVVSQLQNSYTQSEKRPFKVVLLDKGNPSVKGFYGQLPLGAPVRQTTDVISNDHHGFPLSVTFDPHAKINGKTVATCMLWFDPQGQWSFLAGYESSQILSKKEIVYFIAAHEFGHCVEAHQRSLGVSIPAINAGHDRVRFVQERELFANRFAVAFFLVNGQRESAQRVIEFNRRQIDKASPHYHPEDLQRFYEAFVRMLDELDGDLKKRITSVMDVFELTLAVDARDARSDAPR